MKTLFAAGAIAALAISFSFGPDALAAQRSCEQICANAAQNAPQELCVQRCKSVRAKNAQKKSR